MPNETRLIAETTLAHETTLAVDDVRRLADVAYRTDDLAGAISSGSFRTLGMVVAPCSMRSLGEIAYGITSNLLTRAADVALRERRKLVLVAREAPLHAIHLRKPSSGSSSPHGCPAFYKRRPTLDWFDLGSGKVKRWSWRQGRRCP